ncbi:DUF928 domain-containing protein [Calothrix sp. NIES-2098]|uniref:DUF928 domain-containing protein n=1 Tax=Calothrix sp. NIES-2098 TaxID=1954171 RepID=UPI0040402E1E
MASDFLCGKSHLNALTLLVQLRRRHPQTATFQADWQKLLADVDLPELANKPIAPAYNMERSPTASQ